MPKKIQDIGNDIKRIMPKPRIKYEGFKEEVKKRLEQNDKEHYESNKS